MAIVATTLQQTLAAAGVGGGAKRPCWRTWPGEFRRKDFWRVDKFSGGEDEWKAWKFDFKVSARVADANLPEAMEVAEIETWDITAADFSELEDQKWDGQEDKSRQLFDILCMLTSGEAKFGNSSGIRCMASACQKLCSNDFGEGAEAIPGGDESCTPLKTCLRW